MRRSGFILGIGAPAALMTVLAQPVVRDSADHWAPTVPTTAPTMPVALPGMRPASIVLSPTHVAGVDHGVARSNPVVIESQEMGPKSPMKPIKRSIREGCEAPLSSLVGPEARRMVPGRCIS